MKYIVLVGDGMADYEIPFINNKTPLEVAYTPNMDFIVSKGEIGLAKTIPDKMSPGSDVANLSIFGYNPKKYYTGRGPLEAVAMGIKPTKNETVFRCNLVNIDKEIMIDYSASHISTKESKILIDYLNSHLSNEQLKFYSGVSYRHILIIKGNFSKLNCFPPHDITDKNIKEYLPTGKNKNFFIELITKSQLLLENHLINKNRQKKGKRPANSIWLWGQGIFPTLPSFFSKYRLSGSVISAVDLIKGIGKSIGLNYIKVSGATGYIDTNYQGKVDAAIKSLKKKDFVFLHVEAPDEASHAGDVKLKIKAIEDFDKKIVGQILKKLKNYNFKILVIPDHATPISVKTHTNDPVPFAIYSSQDENMSPYKKFSEKEAKKSSLNFKDGYKLMEYFLW